MCPTCGATYIRGENNPNYLFYQAQEYIAHIEITVEEKRKELTRLEKIIELAREKKFI